MPAVFVDLHLHAFELVQLFSNGRLVFGREPGPRFVRPAVVVLCLRHLDIVVEADYLPLLQLFDCGSKAQLSYEHFLLLFLFLLELLSRLQLQDVSLFEFFDRRTQT